MKEYQLKRVKSYLLPEAVYRQALWAVKDLNRMKERRSFLNDSIENLSSSSTVSTIRGSQYSDRVGKEAAEIANLSFRIDAIEQALTEIPEVYRSGILNKLAFGIPYGDMFHTNTWKKWQQVYLYHVAVSLNLY